MTKSEYRHYINGPHWKDRRIKFIDTDPNCARCHMSRNVAVIAYDQDLNVHHRSYANLGCERDEDLESLCRRCHEIETFGTSELHKVATRPCVECCDLVWGMYSLDGHCISCEQHFYADFRQYRERRFCEYVLATNGTLPKTPSEWYACYSTHLPVFNGLFLTGTPQ